MCIFCETSKICPYSHLRNDIAGARKDYTEIKDECTRYRSCDCSSVECPILREIQSTPHNTLRCSNSPDLLHINCKGLVRLDITNCGNGLRDYDEKLDLERERRRKERKENKESKDYPSAKESKGDAFVLRRLVLSNTEDLEELYIYFCNNITSIEGMPKLRRLCLDSCKKMRLVENLPALEYFRYDNCGSVQIGGNITEKMNTIYSDPELPWKNRIELFGQKKLTFLA